MSSGSKVLEWQFERDGILKLHLGIYELESFVDHMMVEDSRVICDARFGQFVKGYLTAVNEKIEEISDKEEKKRAALRQSLLAERIEALVKVMPVKLPIQ